MSGRAVLLAAVLAGTGVSQAAAQLTAGWATGPSSAWAVTGRGAVLRFDGRSWQRAALPASSFAYGVWASSDREAFVVGMTGLFLRWDGTAWQQFDTGTERELVAVRGRSATDVFVVAQSDNEEEAPVLMRWDGTRFSSYPLPFAFRVSSLAVTPTEVIVAGVAAVDPRPDIRRLFGVIARWRAGTWSLDGYDGRRVTDSLVASASYGMVCATATSTTAVGSLEGGGPRAVVRRAARWTLLQPPALPNDPPVEDGWWVFPQDCTPVYVNGVHYARFQAGRWQVVNNPEMAGGVGWGLDARDFWVGTPDGSILRVRGDSVRVVFHTRCLEARFVSTPGCSGFAITPASGTGSTLPQPIRPPSKQRRP